MFEFELPDLGEGIAEGEILAWHVAVGERIREDDVLAEVETDKAAVDVPSPVAGIVRDRHAEAGERVATGEVFVSIEESDGSGAVEDEDADAGPSTTAHHGDGRVFAPPSVRRLARERDIDIATVEGTGPSGRITKADVEAADTDRDTAEPTAVVSNVGDDGDGPKSVVSKVGDDEGETDDESPKSVVSNVSEDDTRDDDERAVRSAVKKVRTDTQTKRREHTLAAPATRRLARELGVDIDAVPTEKTRDGEPYVDAAAVRAVADAASETPIDASESDRREPYEGIRRTIGEQMARSRRTVPHATYYNTVAVPELVAARDRLRPLAKEHGIELTYTPLLLKCVAASLDDHPILASQLDTQNEEIVYRSDRALGVATATDHGLVVPVVEDVDEKGLLELATDCNDLIERARTRDIDREEMQGGVFTITNFGAIGGEYADPIINVPETAILGVGELTERPVADDGEVTAKPTLPLSLAIDHRVIDGADAARFMTTLQAYLTDPTRLLLD